MRSLFTFILIMYSSVAFSQNTNKDLNEIHQQIGKQQNRSDSNTQKLDSAQLYQLNSSSTYTFDSALNNQNLNYFLSEYHERQRKEKQQMWMRFGFVAVLLAMAVIGFRRRSKPKADA